VDNKQKANYFNPIVWLSCCFGFCF